MKRAFALSVLAIAAISGAAAGNVVNLGNLTANSSSVQTVPFVVPAGGSYSSYTLTLNWSAQLGEFEELYPWSSEARWNLYDSTGMTPYVANSFIAAGAMGSADSATLTWTGLMPSQASGTALSFGYYQTIPGSYDSFWDNVTITFGNLAPTIPNSLHLGTVAADTPLTIATGGSIGEAEFGNDTIIVLYDDAGNLVGYDNDSGPELFAQLAGTLTAGTYYAAVADFANSVNNPRFGFAVGGGIDSGTTTLSLTDGINSYMTPGEALSTGGVNWYSFTVVPSPGAASFVGLCGVMGLRRRRR